MDWNTRGVEAGSDVMALTHPQMHTESTNKNFEKKLFLLKKKLYIFIDLNQKLKKTKKKRFVSSDLAHCASVSMSNILIIRVESYCETRTITNTQTHEHANASTTAQTHTHT